MHHEINLLPAELHPGGSSVDLRGLMVKGIIILLTCGLAGAYGGFLYRFFSLQEELSVAKKQLVETLPGVEETETLKEERMKAEARLSALSELINRRSQWACMMRDINGVLPEDVWLSGITIGYHPATGNGENRSFFEGFAQEDPAPPPGLTGNDPAPNAVTIKGNSRSAPAVGVFLNYLQGLNYFQHVRLDNMKEDQGEGSISFVITAFTGESEY